MRVAALYDIHGNLPALEAVLEDLESEEVDRIVVGGDVLPGPMPLACLDLLSGLDVPVDFIRGNGEREVLDAADGAVSPSLPEPVRRVLQWTAERLDRERIRLIQRWPETCRLDVSAVGAVLFCHATPRDDAEIFTRITPVEALLPVFEGCGVPLVVCGHTHMPFERWIGTTRVVNAGSVGMPFGDPGAYWVLLGHEIELRKTRLDLDAVAARIRSTHYPDAEAFAEGNVRSPPSEEDMLERLERAALRA
jgi:predicted phosphodiesterase